QGGADFAALAAQYSTDTSNKDQGGDLGTQEEGYFVEEFDAVAFTAPVGLFPEPVKTSFGYHVIEVLEHGTRKLDETEIEQKRTEKMTDWLTEQRKNPDLVVEFDWEPHVPDRPSIQEVIDALPTPTPTA